MSTVIDWRVKLLVSFLSLCLTGTLRSEVVTSSTLKESVFEMSPEAITHIMYPTATWGTYSKQSGLREWWVKVVQNNFLQSTDTGMQQKLYFGKCASTCMWEEIVQNIQPIVTIQNIWYNQVLKPFASSCFIILSVSLSQIYPIHSRYCTFFHCPFKQCFPHRMNAPCLKESNAADSNSVCNHFKSCPLVSDQPFRRRKYKQIQAALWETFTYVTMR